MDIDESRVFEEEWEIDLNLDVSRYTRHIVAREDLYSEGGFSAYQIQDGLEGAPKASQVKEDLDLMAEVGLLEKEEVGSSKMPDIYHLELDDGETAVRRYADSVLDWADEYTEIIEERLSHPM